MVSAAQARSAVISSATLARIMGTAMSKSTQIAQPLAQKPGTDSAFLAAGCFWGVEHSFRRKFKERGLLDVQVGYIGGSKQQPTYREVCSGTTGHAEAIHVQYDPSKLKYAELLDFFYRMHDPTTANQQGPDVGSQYRSAIFVTNDEQKKVAEEQTALAQTHFGSNRIQTTIERAGNFWPAEEYHQEYLDHNPNGYECPTHFERTWEKIDAEYGGKKATSL